MSKEKILVTGSTGHLGYHLVKLLTEKKHDVRCFARPSSYREHLKELNVEIVFGDLLSLESLKKALSGITVIFHAGAVFNLSSNDNAQIVETAVQGVQNLFAAIKENGSTVRKIIYTSSVEAIGVTHDPSQLLDESQQVTSYKHPYCRAKNESEKLAFRLAAEADVDLVVCNPSTIIGKDDYRLTPSNGMLLTMASSRLPVYVESGQNLVWVEDVALGHYLAYEKGRPGERYILSGTNISMKALMEKVADVVGKTRPLVSLPLSLLYIYGFLSEVKGKLTGGNPSFSRDRAKGMVGSYTYYAYNKAQEELGYSPTPLDNYLNETLQWLKERYS